MTAVGTTAPAILASDATNRVLEVVLRTGERIVVVKSPPGAGKTLLVESLVATAAAHVGLKVGVVTPQNEQAYDLVRRLAAAYGSIGIQMLRSESRELPTDLQVHPDLLPAASHVTDLSGAARIVVGTAAKFFVSSLAFASGFFDVLVCDEAYQVAVKDFDPLFKLANQIVLVGDPGQLAPLLTVDPARFEAAPAKVHWPVPREVLRRFPHVPVVQLQVSWRLPQDTVDVVQPSFYEDLPFVSAATPQDRQLRFAASGIGNPLDRALDLLGTGATIVTILLPPSPFPLDDVDEEVAEVMAAVVTRLLERGVEMGESGSLGPASIGCADAHVASNAAVARHVRQRGVSTEQMMVDTPEQWQGLQRPIMVVKHPLSGKARADAFSLDPGRWCVMLSRHQGACVVVGRDGIGDVLESHQHDCAARPMQAANSEWTGWRAHATVWQELKRRQRLVRL